MSLSLLLQSLSEIKNVFTQGVLESPQYKNLQNEYKELGSRLNFLTRQFTDIVDEEDDDITIPISPANRKIDLSRQSIIHRGTIADFF